MFNKKYVEIDFEFSKSSEKVINLVCCSFKVEGQPVKHSWLLNRQDHKDKLKLYFSRFKKTHIFLAYGAVAECRSFQALGLDPAEFQWIDLFFEHRQLTHNYNKFAYGTYFTKTGMRRFSVPPHFDKSRNKNKDNMAIGLGYVDAVAAHFEVFVDSIHKTKMRDLILLNKKEYTKTEQQAIMDYCDSDLKWLSKLHKSMTDGLHSALKCKPEKILEYQLDRGTWSVALAEMEKEGYPIRVDQVINLRRNFEKAKDTLIIELNKIYPFFIREKKRKSDLIGKWTFKYTQFQQFINTCDDLKVCRSPDFIQPEIGKNRQWPRSEKTEKYKTDEKSLEKFEGIPELAALRQCNKILGQLKWFQIPKESKDDFFNNVGKDGRLRGYLGPYGTLSGRNAPKAKQFILAMSSWLRCLIQPKEGEAIVGIDWASQEFIIAAALSGDQNMIKAYNSGDPYLYFAIAAGAVPKGTNNKWVKNPDLSIIDLAKKMWPDGDFERGGVGDARIGRLKEKFPKEMKIWDTYTEYSKIRGLFKGTTLGLQYGMGAENLAIKLTADTKEFVSEIKAEKLIKLHKRLYHIYWSWLDTVNRNYGRNGFLTLFDGWSLLPNNDNSLSVRNFPTQGTGAVIMRIACKLYLAKGGRICSPMHDAIYAIFNTKTEAHHPKMLGECMQKACEIVLGEDIFVRQDIDIHDHKHVWIESKGKKYYDLLHEYLEHMETDDGKQDRLRKKVFKLVA